jgi:molybdopterin-containing oxidoreductase family iron-sulfur binding subunit
MPNQDSNQSFARLRDKILSQNGKEYWRSIEEFVDAPEFEDYVKHEHPEHADTWDDSLSRRKFIKVMGASLALAGLSGCVIQPPEKIVPYVSQPEGLLPGKPLFFATAYSLGAQTMGLLAKSYDGRPIKVEGNPDHPNSRGATDVRAQASLLDMYDPDRSKQVLYRGEPRTWQNFQTQIRSALDQNRVDGGAGVRFLTQTITSPTLIDQFRRLAAELPNAKLVQYEPVNNDNAMAGARMAFGTPVQTVYHIDKADRILSIDADIFSGFNVGQINDYSKGRTYSIDKKDINRLYTIESRISLTGAKSDHRLAVKPSQISEVAKAIAAAVGVSGASSTYTENAAWINGLAKDLLATKGRSVVIPGDTASPVVHALAHAMNAALGNVGQTVTYIDPITPGADRTQIEQLRELITDIDAGRVKMLVILGGNPVYTTPVDLKLSLERVQEKVPLRIHLGSHVDETSEICHWHVPEKHYLESWGDARSSDGTVSIIQPLIAPLYDGHGAIEVVQLFFKENFDQKDYDIVRAFWQAQNFGSGATTAPAAAPSPNGGVPTGTPANATQSGGATPAATPAPPAGGTNAASFEDRWRRAVHDGIVRGLTVTPKTVSANTAFLSQPEAKPANAGPLEFNILPDPSVHDGRYSNNGWLQELPKPLTKVTWENVAFVSPRTAQQLGVNLPDGYNTFAGGELGYSFINTRGGNLGSDLVTISYQGQNIKKQVPMWVAPGQPDGVITLFMGYGRTHAGQIGNNLGYNAFDVRRSDAMDFGTGNISKTGETTDVASTQIHFNMEGRDLLRRIDVEEFNANPNWGKQEDFYDKSMYPYEQHQATYEKNHKWGMTIDINNCVGCNACVIACQAENNIPVVGKEQVERSREMHWLRIDAYYKGDIDNPEGPAFQPVLCQQCEQAPCEVVCPVHATVHSAEGLNDMVYNRCVGTRYCSNNCPYKVRRFNFFLYQDWTTPQYKLMRNPEVSVRSRGVMEKCTYCVQRIAAARIEAEKDARPIKDGEIVTACQAACPTNVFSFGDMHDQSSQIAKTKKDPRGYNLLNELNTQPRTTYLAGLKNQNKEMPDYDAKPWGGETASEHNAEAESEATTEGRH